MVQQGRHAWCATQGRGERREAREEGQSQNWLMQQALNRLLPSPSQLPFVLRVVADALGLSGPTAMHALNAAVLAAHSANFPLTHVIAGEPRSPPPLQKAP